MKYSKTFGENTSEKCPKPSEWKSVESDGQPTSVERQPCLVVIDGKLQAAFLENDKFNKSGVTHYILAPKEMPDA